MWTKSIINTDLKEYLTDIFTLFHLLKPKKHNLPKLCKMLIKGLIC